MKEKILSVRTPAGGVIELYKSSWKVKSPDATFSIVSGLQGDSLNGVFLCSRLTRFLDGITEGNEPRYELREAVQIFPIVNPQALLAGQRLSPFDNLDPELTVPGNDKGEPTERLMAALFGQTSDSACAIVLGSTSTHYETTPHIQCIQPDRTVKKLAQHTGLTIARDLPLSATHKLTLLNQWRENEIPALILTGGRPHSIDFEICDVLFNAIVRLMLHMGILIGPENISSKGELTIYGKKETLCLSATSAGLFLPKVAVGDVLKKGQSVGELQDIYDGNTIEEFIVPQDGVLVSLRHYPVVFASEPVATVLIEKKRRFWVF